ncbi:hypothetical protein BT93_F0541 [Corymbia citriodora subsp. variegata]|nr:hypothetical protein BT93_F0541 [Corymbia citriodora subsp. variegata]
MKWQVNEKKSKIDFCFFRLIFLLFLWPSPSVVAALAGVASKPTTTDRRMSCRCSQPSIQRAPPCIYMSPVFFFFCSKRSFFFYKVRNEASMGMKLLGFLD